ncbi:hypothetical protein [Pusillimonas sp.]|uniref:hypothetical protein n=1 Tax=Pusillimonas sp. TaxID=3040095 RepID=UPI0037C7553F
MTTSTTNFAIAISLVASAAFTTAHAQESPRQPRQPVHVSGASENVKNDLSDWRKAGFDQHTSDILSYDVYGAEYQRRYAKYQELKRQRTGATTTSE